MKVITAAWQLIKMHVNDSTEIKHLLYALIFLKTYAKSQTVHCAIVDWPDQKEFSCKSWHVIKLLSEQKDRVIRLENRLIDNPATDPNNLYQKIATLTADCSDFHINEMPPWDTKWYLRKFKGPGLKYLVAVATYSNHICFAAGPFLPKDKENKIIKDTLLAALPHDKPIEVNSGPKGDNRLMGPNSGITSEKRRVKSA